MASDDLRSPSRGLYLVLGVVAVLVIVVGMLFMSGTVDLRNDTARAPPDPAETTPTPDRPAQQ